MRSDLTRTRVRLKVINSRYQICRTCRRVHAIKCQLYWTSLKLRLNLLLSIMTYIVHEDLTRLNTSYVPSNYHILFDIPLMGLIKATLFQRNTHKKSTYEIESFWDTSLRALSGIHSQRTPIILVRSASGNFQLIKFENFKHEKIKTSKH